MNLVLFLDVDGVLNNAPYCQRVAKMNAMDPENVAALNSVLVAVPEARIVVSSSWRYLHKTIELMAERLRLEGVDGARVIGMTPRSLYDDERDGRVKLSMIIEGQIRGLEITAWLEENDVVRYVILDDSSDAGAGHDPAVFIQTSWEVGLTMEHAARAIAILRGEKL